MKHEQHESGMIIDSSISSYRVYQDHDKEWSVTAHPSESDRGELCVRVPRHVTANVSVHGAGCVDCVVTGPGSGNAVRGGDGEGDAIRKGSGAGYALRNGSGSGDARRTGAGNGDARRRGPGEGSAIREGKGAGNAKRFGEGDGDAVRRGAGGGDAWRCGSGVGVALRNGAGEGLASCKENLACDLDEDTASARLGELKEKFIDEEIKPNKEEIYITLGPANLVNYIAEEFLVEHCDDACLRSLARGGAIGSHDPRSSACEALLESGMVWLRDDYEGRDGEILLPDA